MRAALAVEDRMFRALAVLRIVVLLNSLALNFLRRDNYDHPMGGLVCVLVMVGWSGFATWAYSDTTRRGVALLVADLAVAVALLVATPLIKGDTFQATIPGYWIAAALLAWAIRFRWPGGLVAGLLLGTLDLVLRGQIEQADYGNAFLLYIGGPIVGFLCGSLQQMAAERDRAERATAAASERARLARVVHDGVLQVLALVQRRGPEIGPDGAELGRLAGEQERALRTLIQAQDAIASDTAESQLDLGSQLGRLGLRPGVEISLPATPVEMDRERVAEIVAVVSACLDNVERHVGEGAPAWVLLEALPDRVEVSVRDEGPGIPEGRIVEAAASGRLGVSESIQGRIRDLGGTAELSSGSFGTEWEFSVPMTGEQP